MENKDTISFSEEEVQSLLGKHDENLMRLLEYNPTVIKLWALIGMQPNAVINDYFGSTASAILEIQTSSDSICDSIQDSCTIIQTAKLSETAVETTKTIATKFEEQAKVFIRHFRKKGDLSRDDRGDALTNHLWNFKQRKHSFALFTSFLESSDFTTMSTSSVWLFAASVSVICTSYSCFYDTHVKPRLAERSRASTNSQHLAVVEACSIPIDYQKIIEDSRARLLQRIREFSAKYHK